MEGKPGNTQLQFGMEPPDSPELLESSLLLFCSFMLGVIFIGGITANLLVLLVFYRKPGLRTTANRFVINLMIINFVACLSLLPIILSDNTSTLVDDHLCFAEQFSSVFCSSVIVYAVLLIAIDQYFAVVSPLHYHCIISTWKGYFMIVSSWGFSAILALLGALQPDLGIFHNSIFRHCSAISGEAGFKRGSSVLTSEVENLQENSYSFYRVVFSVSYVTTAFVIPFGLISLIYYRICAAASGNSRRTRTSILVSEDCAQALRDKFHDEGNEPTERPGSSVNKPSNMAGSQPESSSLLQGESQQSSSNPSLVVTRPSPPRPLAKSETKGKPKCECAREDFEECSGQRSSEESKTKGKADCEVPFLKPTLKNNQSFTKLSSLHIQFSNSIEKFNDIQGNSSERRHSNIPMTDLDPEFENLGKTRSSSVQSNFYDIPSRSSSSTKSTSTSIYIQSSRSSSLNSTSTRLPPSRASSIRSTSSYIVHNIRHRISNASLFRYREEARAARISAMVIVMALFCWLPFFTVFSLHYGISLEKYSHFSHYFDGFSLVLLLMSTVVSPFLFAFRNRQIKKEIRKIFQLCPEHLKRDCSKSFYKNNFSLNLKCQTVQLFGEINKKRPSEESKESTEP